MCIAGCCSSFVDYQVNLSLWLKNQERQMLGSYVDNGSILDRRFKLEVQQ